MSNLELECFAFAEDILKNRPRDINGDTVKYNAADRKKILEILAELTEKLNKNKDKMSADCFRLLYEIINGLCKIVKNKLI